MRRHARTAVVVLAAAALAASLASLYVHYQLVKDSSYTSFCDISETVSCEAVYQSAYGSFYGVPVAAGGAIWSALVLLLALRAMRQPASDLAASTAGYIFILATLGLSAVLYLGYASFFVLGKLCLLCMAVYAAVIGIFVVSGAAASLPMRALPARLGRDLRTLATSPAALVLALLWVVGSASLVAFFPREAPDPARTAADDAPPPEVLSTSQIDAFEKFMAAAPRVPIADAADGARVLILKFNDYQCPPCRQTYMEYKGILGKYAMSHPGQVKFVTKDYPLEPECNTGGIHTAGCEAAAGVRMAREKGRAAEFEEWLFQNQATMSPELVRKGVRDVGLVTDFDAQYPKVLPLVRADVQQGHQLGVNRTPTFFINGIKIEGGLRPAYFDAAIAFELKRPR